MRTILSAVAVTASKRCMALLKRSWMSQMNKAVCQWCETRVSALLRGSQSWAAVLARLLHGVARQHKGRAQAVSNERLRAHMLRGESHGRHDGR